MTIYLYIKQHSKTGLKYFGKTTKSDPYTYLGSGTYWNRHLKKHGTEFVETISLWTFDDQESASKFATKFSLENNIVESEEWANLIIENSYSGWSVGDKHSIESIEKISQSKLQSHPTKGKNISDEHKNKISIALTGKSHSDERKNKISQKQKGISRGPLSVETRKRMATSQLGNKKPTFTCNKCGVLTASKRWHGNNCRIK